MKSDLSIAALAAFGLMAVSAPARADAVEDFYKGKTATVIVSTGAGSYVAIAQTIAKHYPKFIPGHPTMIAKAMPGAGHVNATNFMYNNAPKDGTHIASIGNSIPQHEVTDGKGARFESAKFNWIGSTGISNLMTVVMSSAGVKTIADAKNKEILSGGTGAGSGTVLYPTILNNLIGTKFKIIIGYRSAGDIDLAMERGEVEGATTGWTAVKASKQPWVKEKKLNILVQYAASKHPDLPNVPTMVELARNAEEKQILSVFASDAEIGKSIMAPPGVPADRTAILRKAFNAWTKDPAVLADVKKQRLDFDPMDGAALQKMIAELADTPADVLAKARAMHPSAKAKKK